MRFRSLPGGGKIPVIGLGTWKVGGGSSPDVSQDDRALRGLHAALEMGYTHIDTAEMYADGHTEELVGEVIRGYNRADLLITSKVWPSHLAYQAVLDACRRSLKRLGTDYLDLYLIHWPDDRVPLEETFGALNELVRQDLVRHLGVSNFNLDQLERARAVCETPLATNQAPYSLYHRSYARNGVLSACQESGMIFTAYTPLEKGVVVDDSEVAAIAEQVGCSPVQLALAWLVNQPGVIAIPMSMNPRHLEQNLSAADLELPPEVMDMLDRYKNGSL